MEKINFCEGVIAQMMESEAWKELSGELNWNETQLEKYADKLDWENVCRNGNMFWTISIIEKFKRYINWKALSESFNSKSLSLAIIEKYIDKWDWSAISENGDLTPDFIDKFAERLDWGRVINNWSFCRNYGTEEFVRKNQDRIPSGQFHDSPLWGCLVEKKQDEIRNMVSMD